MSEFTGQVVLITGASGNLGREVARAFAARGATLVLTERRAGSIAAALPELAAAGDGLAVEEIDVTSEPSVADLVARAVAHRGRIDVLVNTVGGYRAGTPVHETPVATWDHMLALNARSAFLVSRAVLPHMLQRGEGRIVNIAAPAALHGAAGSSAYAASKAAVARLTESLAAEYKRRGIRVNAVLPGTLDTPPNRAAMPDADHSRWVTPAALAEVIVFLASAAAAPIHGVLLPVLGLR